MINKWHSLLGMVKYDESWHKNDVATELEEYNQENNLIKKWSELSDVVYTCTRGRWSGYDLEFPLSKSGFYLGAIYMFPKYTSRWLFFRHAGKKARAHRPVHEVRNPRKTHKLDQIAERNDINKKLFQEICEKQLSHWILLP